MQMIGQYNYCLGPDRQGTQRVGICLSQPRNVISQQGLFALRKANGEKMAGAGGVDAAIT